MLIKGTVRFIPFLTIFQTHCMQRRIIKVSGLFTFYYDLLGQSTYRNEI